MFSARLGFMRPDSVPPGGVPWTPSDITSANMLAWFDATDPTDYVSEGLNVPELLDKSGNGVKMVQAELSRQGKPADLDNISTVEFDGMDDYYTGVDRGPNLTQFTINSGYSFFTVSKVYKDSSGPQQIVHISRGSSPTTQAHVQHVMTPNHEYSQFIRTTNSSGQGFKRPGVQTEDWALKYHGLTANNPTDGWYNVYNGDVLRSRYTGSNLTTNPLDRLVIGGMVRGYDPVNGADTFDNFTKMNWNKTLLFDNQLSDDERQKLEGWAAHQLGITDKLPVDHPYKTTAPEK